MADDDLVALLTRPDAYPHPVLAVQVVETHISWVFLTGQFAYKVKKPVRYDFVDFSTLALRKHYCDEEVALNRRFAPALYLGVSRIVRRDGSLKVDNAEDDGDLRREPDAIVEYCVRMVQFDQSAQLDRALEQGELGAVELARFGAHLASTHAGLPRVDDERRRTITALFETYLLDNFAPLPKGSEHDEDIAFLRAWCATAVDSARPLIEQRVQSGFVRECHGDLHLSNMVRIDDEIWAFDCIEFNASYRFIDVLNDAAFLFMDCLLRERGDLAYAFLDGYLAESGDYASLPLLRLFTVYRTLVRAKVAALGPPSARNRVKLKRHLGFARRLTSVPARPTMILMCGLSGSGKSWLAAQLVPAFQAVRIRSDVERKRIAGLGALASSGSTLDSGLYGAEQKQNVYEHLLVAARSALIGGESPIVDATLLTVQKRRPFIELAEQMGVAVRVVYTQAPLPVLEQRVNARTGDPSEATVAVLHAQVRELEPPSGAGVVNVDTSGDIDLQTVLAALR